MSDDAQHVARIPNLLAALDVQGGIVASGTRRLVKAQSARCDDGSVRKPVLDALCTYWDALVNRQRYVTTVAAEAGLIESEINQLNEAIVREKADTALQVDKVDMAVHETTKDLEDKIARLRERLREVLRSNMMAGLR